MSITVYFGKLNLVSEHIYKVYDRQMDMHDILQDVLLCFNEKMSYTEEHSYIGEDGEPHTQTTDYRILIKEKTDTYIRGRLDKTSRLYYKETDPVTRDLKSKSVTNTEAIEFYFDVFHEMIGYNTSNRFGYKKFLKIFSILLNNGITESGKDYRFTVDRYTHGIDIKSLEKELKGISAIQKLKFSYQPVNPDTDVLLEIQENGRDRLEEFEEANLSSKSVLLTSTSQLGLRVDSAIVQEQIKDVDELHHRISAKEATQNGYIIVEATGKDGITWSTEDKAPVKRHIRRMDEFQKACEEVIRKKLLTKFLKNDEE